jgi:hypothetical protein
MDESELREALQSLRGVNARHLCPDHRPTGEYVRLPKELGGGITYEVTCPNCGFHGLIHPDAVGEL